MECSGHVCIHWTSSFSHFCHNVDDVTCRRLHQLPDLWVRCRAAEAKMEGPNSRPPQPYPSFIPPAIATDSQQTPPPDPPIKPPTDPPPMLQSPSSPGQSHLHTPPPHTPHSPLLPHTPITPLPHTPMTPHSPLTPLTSQSTLASEASVDSGVASAHSLDLLHNSSNVETHALRRRAGSSISSGTSEVWLGSLDGDPAGLEVLPELWPHSESPTTSSQGASTSHHSPSSPQNSPRVLLLNSSSSNHSPSSPGQSPTPSHQSPPMSLCHNSSSVHSIHDQHSPTQQHHILPPTETSVGIMTSPAIEMECVWQASSSPRDSSNHHKEAFSSVIPFHPSALKSKPGPFWPTSEKDGKNELTNTLKEYSLSSQCVLYSDESLTDFSVNDDVLYDKKKSVKDCQSVLPGNFDKKCESKKTKKLSGLDANSSDVDRMAREGCVWIDKFASLFVKQILEEALAVSCSLGWSIKCSGQCQREQCREEYQKKESSWWVGGSGKSNRKSSIPLLGLSCGSPGLCWTPELPYSPSHRPHSRSSLGSSLSFSHDSLVSSGPRMDDSHLITGAVSHDALLFPTSKTPHSDVSDIYNVPLDGDIYAVPVDVVKPNEGQILHPKAVMLQPKKRHHRRHAKHSAAVNAANILNVGGGLKKVSNSHDQGSSSKQLKESGISRSRQHSGQSTGSVSGGEILRVSKRHSVPSNIGCALSMTPKHGSNKEEREPIHMTLEEVRKSFHESDDTINCNKNHRIQQEVKVAPEQSKICRIIPFTSMKSCKRKDNSYMRIEDNRKKGRSISSNIRNTLITIFGLKKGTKSSSTRLKNGSCVETATQGFSDIAGNGVMPPASCPTSSSLPNHAASTTITKIHHNQHSNHRTSNGINTGLLSCLGNHRTEPDDPQIIPAQAPVVNNITSRSPAIVTNRALPPLPLQPSSDEKSQSEVSNTTASGTATSHSGSGSERREEEGCDFASIIEKVKDCGWYWGPISGEAAEKVLANEPDGSFIVRDSSDHHYIFSLTFKLNGFIRHVRIEHDQGNFSFGGFTKFKSQTIVEFIENAVEHSRSGRYLFFLHRRPVLGPMRVQLLHPVSRFKHIQSLQHLCRFVIVKHVRRDLIGELPLPQRLKDYLCSPHYYSERVEQCMAAAAAAIAASTTASDAEDKSASSGVMGDEHSVPNQVLQPSLEEIQDSSLPAPPTLVPGFPGVPQPVMDRASQTSQATSPNPPNHHYTDFGSHDDSTQASNLHNGTLPDYNSVNSNSLPTLQDLELDVRSSQHHHLSSNIATIPKKDESTTDSASHSPICCSPAHVERDITYPMCPRVTLTSQAHTAASASPVLQGNLAFAHPHKMTGASGPLSLNSSVSDVLDASETPLDRTTPECNKNSNDNATSSVGGVTTASAATASTREFFQVHPCRGLDDQVFEDLGGV
ncbi:uncharacterized protein [Macrobrachium rosenbergii]|uniref:uncharacterized protein isoform X1 n=2 Tax=Macrobrachium rosenbergii TaxID=79674 RepID=UPI0034D41325